MELNLPIWLPLFPTRFLAMPINLQNSVCTDVLNLKILPAGSFLPDLSKTPTIWSFTSALEIKLNSLGLGKSSGILCKIGGKANKEPTIWVASVLGTPFKSERKNQKNCQNTVDTLENGQDEGGGGQKCLFLSTLRV